MFLNVGCMIHKRIQIKEYVETVEGICQSDSLRARHNTPRALYKMNQNTWEQTESNEYEVMNIMYARGIFSHFLKSNFTTYI